MEEKHGGVINCTDQEDDYGPYSRNRIAVIRDVSPRVVFQPPSLGREYAMFPLLSFCCCPRCNGETQATPGIANAPKNRRRKKTQDI
jgi:hypothetical protein